MEHLAMLREERRRGAMATRAAAARAAAADKADGPMWRVNTSGVPKSSACSRLLGLLLDGREGGEGVEDEGQPWRRVEDAQDQKSHIYFVWSGKALLERLNHTSAPVPRLPSDAWISRVPGISHLCDKVNMALSLQMLQRLWPDRFSFWPRSWLLPKETEKLERWMRKHPDQTVIVKPSGGSLGEGIFLAQSVSDLDLKLSAKSHWGAGFSALAQQYLPQPLLVGGMKFDLRVYVALTSLDPLKAYMCREGLARFCTTAYEAPTQENCSNALMHLTNYSLNKGSANFVTEDPYDVSTAATKRPLSTLLSQMAVQEAASGRVFDESQFFNRLEEVVAVLLQAFVPVLTVTRSRVARECRARRQTAKGKPPKKVIKARDESDAEEEEDTEDEEEEEGPLCFQLLGVDVLLDMGLQPWLLEVNARPSMDVEHPVRLADAPEGSRRCAGRCMDGAEHTHVLSEVDVRVKRTALGGAFELLRDGTPPEQYIPVNFDKYSPSEAQETLAAVAELYERAGGTKKAFTTSGLRKVCNLAVGKTLTRQDLDVIVSKWKHQGYREDADLEDDMADIGVLDFASLLEEVAAVWAKGSGLEGMDALVGLLEACDCDEE